eukprot:365228-Chlamydomonas_euryale.AAC.45
MVVSVSWTAASHIRRLSRRGLRRCSRLVRDASAFCHEFCLVHALNLAPFVVVGQYVGQHGLGVRKGLQGRARPIWPVQRHAQP